MSKYERISCHHFIEVNGYAYFSNWFYNGLFRVELETGNTMFLGGFENGANDGSNLHYELYRQGEMIYFFPRRGRHVHIYSLDDGFMYAIEVRKESEAFFRIGEVAVDETSAFLFPMEENAPTRRFDLRTWNVTDMTDRNNICKGNYLSETWTVFSEAALLENYHIEKADKFSWTQMPDGRWCAFLPMGRQLLWYTPEVRKLEAVPLTVINENYLDDYLRPLRQAFLCQGQLRENSKLTFKEYLKAISPQADDKKVQYKNNSGLMIGDSIWNHVKN